MHTISQRVRFLTGACATAILFAMFAPSAAFAASPNTGYR
jgi:hypothetical protein